MKLNRIATQKIENQVKAFMGTHRVCWAIPGTENHSSNFYGDSYLCRFTRNDLTSTIIMAVENWHTDKTPDEITREICADMQFEKPATAQCARMVCGGRSGTSV